jgi:hypothetical protein
LSAFDRFGNLDDAQLHPWWEDPLGVADAPGIRASAYTLPGNILAVVSNRGPKPMLVTLRPDNEGLGVETAGRYSDLERPAAEPSAVTGGKIAMTVPARDFRLVWIR